MPRKQKKYHVIYKTTCKVNNKYYVGMHSTDNLDDGYVGSGKRLWNAIRKHGKENFEVEFLEFFENRKDLIDREIEMVNEELLQDPMCMNLMIGGKGGFVSVENQFKRSQAGGLAMKSKLSNTKILELCSIGGKCAAKLKVGIHDEKYKYNWTGKKHSNETKQKMSISHKNKGLDKQNSQFGTCWILKHDISKKINKQDLDSYINDGWVKGRKLKMKE